MFLVGSDTWPDGHLMESLSGKMAALRGVAIMRALCHLYIMRGRPDESREDDCVEGACADNGQGRPTNKMASILTFHMTLMAWGTAKWPRVHCTTYYNLIILKISTNC